MTSAETLQSIAGAIYMATITTVGIRLMVLSRRNRALPELLLGASLLVGGTFGAVLEAAGMSGDVYFDKRVAGALIAVGKAMGIVGFVCQALFIRMVFRPNAIWATALVGAILFALLGAYTAFAAAGTFTTGVMPRTIFLLELGPRCAGSLWLIAESIRYYGAMKRRLALGLAEPIVTDRFRLWAIAAIAGLVLLATSVPPVIWPAGDARWLELLIPVFALSGVVSSGTYLLAFFPPAFYRRRVEARLGGRRRAPGRSA